MADTHRRTQRSPSQIPASYAIPDPPFAEWKHYSIDYRDLKRALDTHRCAPEPSVQCLGCEAMVEECRRSLAKVGHFVHIKARELEHSIQTAEAHLRTLASHSTGEQLVLTAQLEEALDATASEVLALSRFRRSNFSAFMALVHASTCARALLDLLHASPLFAESSIDAQQMHRISLIHHALQLGADRLPHTLFPNLEVWRGWIAPENLARVLRRLSRRSGASAAHCVVDIDHPHTKSGRVARTTAYFDSPAMDAYAAHMALQPARSVRISVVGDDAHVESVTTSGAWGSSVSRAGAWLESRLVKSFLDSEYRVRDPRTGAVDRVALRLQKDIVVRALRPVVFTREERAEYTWSDARVVVRYNVAVASDGWGALADAGGGLDVPFAVIEVHPVDALPEWLCRLFFESGLVHAVLDFDLYVHAVAVCRSDLVSDLPYWIVECERGLDECEDLVSSPESPPSETTVLLGSPSACSCRRARSTFAVVLLCAVALSTVAALWPWREKLGGLAAEVFDLVLQWAAQLGK